MKELEILTIIIGTKDSRNKIIFNFKKDKTIYSIVKDYILIESSALNTKQIENILNSIKESKINIRSKDYGYHYEFNSYYWILKFEYTNDTVYYKSGCDILPSNWNLFTRPFGELLSKEVGALC